MWNALRKKVNKSSRSYQLSSGGSHNQSDSEDSDTGASAAPTKDVLKRYMKIASCNYEVVLGRYRKNLSYTLGWYSSDT